MSEVIAFPFFPLARRESMRVEMGRNQDGGFSVVIHRDAGQYFYFDHGPGDTLHLYYEIGGEKFEAVSLTTDGDFVARAENALSRVLE